MFCKWVIIEITCIFFISDYWGEFCKSSIKLPPQKQKVQTSKINKSTWFSQGCSKCSSHMIRPAVICSRATNWFNLLQLNLLFFSSSTFWYLAHNHKPINQVLQVKDKIHFLYQSGEKRVCSAKMCIWITQSRDKDKRHRHKTDSVVFSQPRLQKLGNVWYEATAWYWACWLPHKHVALIELSALTVCVCVSL